MLKYDFKTDETEALRKRGVRWSVLNGLHKFLCSIEFDVPYNPNLEVARSIIETRLRKKDANTRAIMYIDDLLDKVQNKLAIKAIPLTEFRYWEDLLNKARKEKITREEFMKVPFMRSIIKEYDFINNCISTEPIRTVLATKIHG